MMSRSGSWSPVGPAGRGRRGDVRRSRGDVRRSRGDVRRSRVARILARLATPELVDGRAVATDRRRPGWTVLSGGRSGAQRGGGRGRLMDGGTDTGGAAEGTMVELAEIMTADVFTVAPDTPVVAVAVAAAMVKRRLGSAVVMQGQMLVGIFTERDVLRAAASGRDLARSPMSRWMTRDPETARPNADSEQAAEIMLGSGFRHLPVVEGNALVGIVSLRDLLSVRVRRHLS